MSAGGRGRRERALPHYFSPQVLFHSRAGALRLSPKSALLHLGRCLCCSGGFCSPVGSAPLVSRPLGGLAAGEGLPSSRFCRGCLRPHTKYLLVTRYQFRCRIHPPGLTQIITPPGVRFVLYKKEMPDSGFGNAAFKINFEK